MCAQFPDGLGPGRVTGDAINKAVKRRRRGMIESALRHPFAATTASAPTTGTQGEACVGRDAEPADHFLDDIPMRLDERRWEEVELSMLTLLWANNVAAATAPYPDAHLLATDSQAAHSWREQLRDIPEAGIVMGREAVKLAAAQWDDSKGRERAGPSEGSSAAAENLLRLVRAAAREGQGLIVQPVHYCTPRRRMLQSMGIAQ
jgi:hypothetical protein